MQILLNWQLNTTFGWGILGLNLFKHLSDYTDLQVIMGREIGEEDIRGLNALSRLQLMPALVASNQFWQQERTSPGLSGIVIDALGNGLHGGEFQGEFTIGRVVSDDTTRAESQHRLRRYDAILTACKWNAELLEQSTGREIKVIHEGIDPALFFPGPKSDMVDRTKFYIFSGGKIEHRKAQDLTLMAFKIFSQRHPDAVLVTAWHSPWPQLSLGFQGRLAQPLRGNSRGELDILRWVHDNGIDAQKVIDIGQVAHTQMAEIYRNVDVALQPSRAEPGTSLPVKEAMACGVPVIAAQNTGMLDLLCAENSLPLTRQKISSQYNQIGWGESDVEEIVAALEWIYQHREQARKGGLQAAQWIRDHNRTWKGHTDELISWLRQIL